MYSNSSTLKYQTGLIGWIAAAIIIVLIIALLIYIERQRSDNDAADCDWYCERELICYDETTLDCICIPNDPNYDQCTYECNSGRQRCSNMGSNIALGNLTTESGLQATVDKWQAYNSCVRRYNGCYRQCPLLDLPSSERASLDDGQPVDLRELYDDFNELYSKLSDSQICYDNCEKNFDNCKETLGINEDGTVDPSEAIIEPEHLPDQ